MLIVYKDGKLSKSEVVQQYTGEKTGGEFKDWKLFGTDPSAFIRESYGILSSRNATLYHTSAIARACVNKPLNYSIGKGLYFKSLPDGDFLGMSSDGAKEWGRKFSQLLHYEKKASKYYAKQKILAREQRITGDALLYFVREEQDLKPFDIVITGGSAIDWEKTFDNYTLGIKTDDFNRRKGFWSSVSQKYVPFKDSEGNQIAIQFLSKDRAGQLRGLSIFSSEIARAKNLDRVWDATLERMVQEATQLGYFNASNTDVAGQARAMARMTAGNENQGSEDLTATEIGIGTTAEKTGGMYVLENSEGMQFTDLKTPGNNFGLANEWTVNLFGMATGIPPEVLMSKYSTSFTAHKGALNDFIKIFMDDRAEFIDTVDSVVNLEYLKHFVRTKQIEVSPAFWTDYKIQLAYLEGVHLGPIPGHINPLQEVNADIKAQEHGFTLKSSIATKYGNDFWNMIDSWEEEQKRWFEASPEKQAEQMAEALKAEASASHQTNPAQSFEEKKNLKNKEEKDK